nr:YdaS family helix-turn-helix protein [Novosphingobium sp. HII-3]
MPNALTPSDALRQAVNLAGGQSATARICQRSQAAVWKWLNKGKLLPAECVLAMEAATGVSRHDLRPDIYPSPHFAPSATYNHRHERAVAATNDSVACDHESKAQRKDHA